MVIIAIVVEYVNSQRLRKKPGPKKNLFLKIDFAL